MDSSDILCSNPLNLKKILRKNSIRKYFVAHQTCFMIPTKILQSQSYILNIWFLRIMKQIAVQYIITFLNFIALICGILCQKTFYIWFYVKIKSSIKHGLNNLNKA